MDERPSCESTEGQDPVIEMPPDNKDPFERHSVFLEGFEMVGRSTFLRIDLDAIWYNIQVLKSRCARNTAVIAVIKGNAYGHGSVDVGLHLYQCGIRHFAVATAAEGRELRENGLNGFIQILGNNVLEEIPVMLEYDLTPTVASVEFVTKWAETKAQYGTNKYISSKLPAVVIKVDTGMSRNGCQCSELAKIMKECQSNEIPVHSIMTHFAQAWDDPIFTQKQLDLLLKVTQPYRENGVKVHAANSAAIIQGFGTDLDFVRPGIAIYGLTLDTKNFTAQMYKSLGLKPALTWVAKPTLVKYLNKGRTVGYDQTYIVSQGEHIATFGLGYADGYNRLMSDKGVLTDESGQVFDVVGRVSMDAITVKVNSTTTKDSVFYVIKDDYESPNCVMKMATDQSTIPYEIGTSLADRLPRLYHSSLSNGLYQSMNQETNKKSCFSCCRCSCRK